MESGAGIQKPEICINLWLRTWRAWRLGGEKSFPAFELKPVCVNTSED
jgi:hypothetical protein